MYPYLIVSYLYILIFFIFENTSSFNVIGKLLIEHQNSAYLISFNQL